MTTAVAAAPVVYREATLADVPTLVEMGQRFRTAVYAKHLRENPAQMAALAARLIEQPDGHVIVAERDGALIGTIGLLRFPHHFSGEITVGELFFWVDPEHRGHGVRLLRMAERYAREHGATTMQMIAPTPDVGRLYQRLGYVELEVAYTKDLSWP